MGRLRYALICLLLACSTISVSSAAGSTRLACQAYGRIILPNGERGVLCSWGEQLDLSSGLRRIFLTDTHGQVLARSHASFWRLFCEQDRCDAFDQLRRLTLELDPTTFRVDAQSGQQRAALWTLDHGDESWGFHTRPIAWSDYSRVYLRALLVLLAFGALVGALLIVRQTRMIGVGLVAAVPLVVLGYALLLGSPLLFLGLVVAAGAIPVLLVFWAGLLGRTMLSR
jgi:hypothetical protein